MIIHAFLAVALQAAPEPPAPPTPAPMPPAPPPASFSTIVREARAKLDAGDFAGAAERYAEALRARPEAAAAAYNQGVALYREGKYADAARTFSQAAEIASEGTKTDPVVEARSTYNKAASHYRATKAQAEAAERMLASEGAKVLDGAEAPAKEPVDPEALKAAIEDAQKSLQGFKDAALNDPTDRDARANAQQSLRLLRALEELRKQQEQQKQDQDQEQKQDQEQQQQQQQDQQQPKDQKQQEQQQQKDPQSGDQGEAQPPKDPGDSKDQPKQEPSDGEQDAPKQPADQPPPPKPSGERPGEMTKQEADRLLQAIRDRERERRAEQERAAAVPRNRRPPAKDW
ncbi:MAG: tetratricopeptide repeat protein [Phycisphaerales bacterium]